MSDSGARLDDGNAAAERALDLMRHLVRYEGVPMETLRAHLHDAARANRLGVTWTGGPDDRTIVGFILWANVSEEVERTLRHLARSGAVPIGLGRGDWDSGDRLWLLDILADTREAATGVLHAFRSVAEGRTFEAFPAAASMVEPDVLGKLAVSTKSAAPPGLTTPRRGRGAPVRIESERLVLASLPREDAPTLCAWMTDPRVTAGLLQSPRIVDADEARRFVDGFDDLRSHLLGLRDRRNERLLGFLMAHIDPRQRNATISIVIGERRSLRRHVGEEAIRALMDWLFTVRGVEKIIMQVAASNRTVVKWTSPWIRLEGTLVAEVRRPDGARVDLLRFGLLRSEWSSTKAASIERTLVP